MAKNSKDKNSKDKNAKGKNAKGKNTKGAAVAVRAKAKKPLGTDAAVVTEVAVAEPESFSAALRAGEDFTLTRVDPHSTPAFAGDKAAGEALTEAMAAQASELQERLYAESKGGGGRSLLLVVQGMDTSGKGGVMRHVVGAMDPQGVDLTSFTAPSAEERRHPFLWRVRNALPRPGQIGVFDRSHYEDVLVVRVHDLVPRATWARRYTQINAFEASVVDSGTTIIKVMLHLSADEQRGRLAERLERPDKHWKYNPGDVEERAQWPAYQEAYQVAVQKCSTEAAPWFVVPADRKWYARLAVMGLVLEHLRAMDPQWPTADFDVEVEKERLAAT